MQNNDILRRLRYTFEINDSKMISIFEQAGCEVTRVQISAWLKKDGDDEMVEITNPEMSTFLNGFINEKRGKKDGEQPKPENQLSNNIVFRKLKIALNLQSEDILDVLEKANVEISNHELSAFFRKKGHKHYRVCKDQMLRNFLKGIQLKYRGTEDIDL